jgi:SAM-dependent methyltransferase
MKDYSEEDMPGWKTPDMRQSQDTVFNFRSRRKIEGPIEDLRAVLSEQQSLLDVGCGYGHLYGDLKHSDYFGIDLFQEHIDRAREAYPGARFECMDFREMEGKWDVVWCSRVLIHLPNFIGNVEKLLSLTRQKLLLVVAIGEDSIRKIDGFWFRHVSEDLLKSIGPCEIKKYGTYSTVIYDPRISR